MEIVMPGRTGAIAMVGEGATVEIELLQWQEPGEVLHKHPEIALTVKHDGDALLLGGDCFPDEPLRVPLRGR